MAKHRSHRCGESEEGHDGDQDSGDEELPASEEDEGNQEALWTPVADLEEPDISLPGPVDENQYKSSPWQPVADMDGDELTIELDRLQKEDMPSDPWGPVHSTPETEPIGVRPSAKVAVALPPPLLPVHDDPDLLSSPERSIPWRCTANINEPDLVAVSCVADPTSEQSRLLVASWDWVPEAPGGTRLRFRLADDGEFIDSEAAEAHLPALDCTIQIGDDTLRGRLLLETSRDERGLRLGRDQLAGRFVVDPSVDQLATDDH